jgi:hypothetical protein
MPNNTVRSRSMSAVKTVLFPKPPGDNAVLKPTPSTTATAAIQRHVRPAKAIPGYLLNTSLYRCREVAKYRAQLNGSITTKQRKYQVDAKGSAIVNVLMTNQEIRTQKNRPYSPAAGSIRIRTAAKPKETAESAVHNSKACRTLILSISASKPYVNKLCIGTHQTSPTARGVCSPGRTPESG